MRQSLEGKNISAIFESYVDCVVKRNRTHWKLTKSTLFNSLHFQNLTIVNTPCDDKRNFEVQPLQGRGSMPLRPRQTGLCGLPPVRQEGASQ